MQPDCGAPQQERFQEDNAEYARRILLTNTPAAGVKGNPTAELYDISASTSCSEFQKEHTSSQSSARGKDSIAQAEAHADLSFDGLPDPQVGGKRHW